MVKRYSMFRNPQPWRSVQGPEDEPSLEAKKATDRNHSAYVVMVEEKARPQLGLYSARSKGRRCWLLRWMLVSCLPFGASISLVSWQHPRCRSCSSRYVSLEISQSSIITTVLAHSFPYTKPLQPLRLPRQSIQSRRQIGNSSLSNLR